MLCPAALLGIPPRIRPVVIPLALSEAEGNPAAYFADGGDGSAFLLD